MAELAGSDPTFCGYDASDEVEIPMVVLARWAAIASQRASMYFVPTQPRMSA